MKIFDRSRVEALCGPTRPYHIVSEIVPWVFFLACVTVLAAFWENIPEQIAMQTDFRGNVTGWGSKRELIYLCGVYFVVNLALWIVGFFPQSWNAGVRVRVLGFRRAAPIRNYSLARDLLCDFHISMSLLFAAALLWTAFCEGRYGFAFGALVALCLLVPVLRYLVRLALRR